MIEWTLFLTFCCVWYRQNLIFQNVSHTWNSRLISTYTYIWKIFQNTLFFIFKNKLFQKSKQWYRRFKQITLNSLPFITRTLIFLQGSARQIISNLLYSSDHYLKSMEKAISVWLLQRLYIIIRINFCTASELHYVLHSLPHLNLLQSLMSCI